MEPKEGVAIGAGNSIEPSSQDSAVNSTDIQNPSLLQAVYTDQVDEHHFMADVRNKDVAAQAATDMQETSVQSEENHVTAGGHAQENTAGIDVTAGAAPLKKIGGPEKTGTLAMDDNPLTAGVSFKYTDEQKMEMLRVIYKGQHERRYNVIMGRPYSPHDSDAERNMEAFGEGTWESVERTYKAELEFEAESLRMRERQEKQQEERRAMQDRELQEREEDRKRESALREEQRKRDEIRDKEMKEKAAERRKAKAISKGKDRAIDPVVGPSNASKDSSTQPKSRIPISSAAKVSNDQAKTTTPKVTTSKPKAVPPNRLSKPGKASKPIEIEDLPGTTYTMTPEMLAMFSADFKARGKKGAYISGCGHQRCSEA